LGFLLACDHSYIFDYQFDYHLTTKQEKLRQTKKLTNKTKSDKTFDLQGLYHLRKTRKIFTILLYGDGGSRIFTVIPVFIGN